MQGSTGNFFMKNLDYFKNIQRDNLQKLWKFWLFRPSYIVDLVNNMEEEFYVYLIWNLMLLFF